MAASHVDQFRDLGKVIGVGDGSARLPRPRCHRRPEDRRGFSMLVEVLKPGHSEDVIEADVPGHHAVQDCAPRTILLFVPEDDRITQGVPSTRLKTG